MRGNNEITRLKEKSILGAALYKISGHNGVWVERMVEVPPHRSDKYLEDLVKTIGKDNVFRREDGVFFMRQRLFPETEKFQLWRDKRNDQ